MQLTLAAEAPAGSTSLRAEVQQTRALLEGVEDSRNHYSVDLMQGFGDYSGPRHKHDFDQVRYVIAGEYAYGKDKFLPAGNVAYFPEGLFYGPQIRRPGLLMFAVELGGASGCGHISRRQKKIAKEILNKRGVATKDTYSYVDDTGRKRGMDVNAAITEVIRGARIEYPRPRYEDIVVMDPESFDWVADPQAPGVTHKWLGTFNERGMRIGFTRVEPGAILNVGLHEAPELLFITQGSATCGGKACPLHSAIAFEPLEGPVAIAAGEPTEVLRIQSPVFPAATSPLVSAPNPRAP